MTAIVEHARRRTRPSSGRGPFAVGKGRLGSGAHQTERTNGRAGRRSGTTGRTGNVICGTTTWRRVETSTSTQVSRCMATTAAMRAGAHNNWGADARGAMTKRRHGNALARPDYARRNNGRAGAAAHDERRTVSEGTELRSTRGSTTRSRRGQGEDNAGGGAERSRPRQRIRRPEGSERACHAGPKRRHIEQGAPVPSSIAILSADQGRQDDMRPAGSTSGITEEGSITAEQQRRSR